MQNIPNDATTTIPQTPGKEAQHPIEYKVNDEDQTTVERYLTAKQILENAGIDPTANYLSEVFPQHISFEGKPEKVSHP